MIATNEAVDVLRHGWQDAASTLAADVPEVAELLQARLEIAVANERLEERHLLDTIQEVESVASRAGSPSGQALARRLRRTVYEYLLALDAARPLETVKAPLDQPATPDGSLMVGAEEVAALGHASRGRAGDETDREPEAVSLVEADESEVGAEDAAGANAPAARRRFGLRRRQRHGAEAQDANDPVNAMRVGDPAAAVAGPPEPDATEPNWQFTAAAAPAVFDGGLDLDATVDRDTATGAADARSRDAGGPFSPEPEHEDDAEPVAAATADAEASVLVQSTAEADDPPPTFVAPRAGFHIVEDAPAHRPDQNEARLEMPAFTADEENAHQLPSEGVDAADQEPEIPVAASEIAPGDGSDFLAWRPPIAPAPDQAIASASDQATVTPEGEAAVLEQPVEAALPAAQPAPASAPIAPVQAPADEEDGETRGWGVRKPGEAHSTRRGVPVIAVPAAEDDPFESNTRLSDMRRRIEERLRRKRCDEAAALLQEIAQETGGRAVAELAMNVGDRCRALGKSNAALNCYLAAARSDPVYELPLSRLADICIDNQDTELAVSYLERIARIYRFREDDRAALRTYRRIATIAPHREDVLTLLMNAQRTGQLQ